MYKSTCKNLRFVQSEAQKWLEPNTFKNISDTKNYYKTNFTIKFALLYTQVSRSIEDRQHFFKLYAF